MAVQPLGTRLSDALPLDWIAHETLPLPPPTSSSSSSLLMLLGNCIANGIKETVDWLCRSAGDPLDVPPPPPLLRVQSSADTNERPTKIISFTLFGCLAAWLISWMDAVGYYWTCWWWWKRFRPSRGWNDPRTSTTSSAPSSIINIWKLCLRLYSATQYTRRSRAQSDIPMIATSPR